jgi:hypothetical protein
MEQLRRRYLCGLIESDPRHQIMSNLILQPLPQFWLEFADLHVRGHEVRARLWQLKRLLLPQLP